MELRDVSQHYFYKYEHIQKCTLTNCFIKKEKIQKCRLRTEQVRQNAIEGRPLPSLENPSSSGCRKSKYVPPISSHDNFQCSFQISSFDLISSQSNRILLLSSFPPYSIHLTCQPRMQGAPTSLYIWIFHNSELMYVLWAQVEILLFHSRFFLQLLPFFSTKAKIIFNQRETFIFFYFQKNGSFGLAASCFAFQYEKSGGRVERAFSCVTQIKLFTLDKLSNNIFCCLSVCLSGK